MKAHSIILLILMTILLGLLPAQVQSTELVPQDASVDSVAYLLALTRDGVVRVLSEWQHAIDYPWRWRGKWT